MFDFDNKIFSFITRKGDGKKPQGDKADTVNNVEPGEIEDVSDSQIDLSAVEDPTAGSKRLKKTAVLGVIGVATLFGLSMIFSNVFMTKVPATKKESANLPVAAKSMNPANGLPDKYADLSKYEAVAEKQAKQKALNNPSGQKAGQKPETDVSLNPAVKRRIYAPDDTGTTYVPVAQRVPAVPAVPQNPAAAAAGQATQAARERETYLNSALAFKSFTTGQNQQAQNNGVAVPLGSSGQVSNGPSYVPSSTAVVSDSVFTLTAGSVIQATLLTGVTSDVPNGDVVAQVRQNIYDSLTGEHLLIPQGSKLIGVSGTAGSRGNKRIGVSFTRIILPDGSNIYLPQQKAIDGVGYPGLSDKYDDHGSTLYRTAFLSAIFAAVAQSATGNSSGSDNRSPGQEAVSGAAASILNTAQKLVERDASMNPTITISPGFQFSVFVNNDVGIGEYLDD